MKTSGRLLVWISFNIVLALGYPLEDHEEYWLLDQFQVNNIFSISNDYLNNLLIEPKAPYCIFNLYTKSNQFSGQELKTGDQDALRESNFNASNPTRITVHGWRNNAQGSVNTKVRAAYFERGDYNLIVVDWTSLSYSFYLTAKAKSVDVGREIVEFLKFLRAEGGISYKDVTCIGHSLGAHVCGLTGKQMRNGKINTIFALDPAGPFYFVNDPEERVNAGDADYVEIIHTNGGLQGFGKPIGYADFYPNWGSKQPGCTDFTGACSHERAVDLFVESLNAENPFVAVKCANYTDIENKSCSDSNGHTAKMGGEPSNYGKNVSGIYYLATNSVTPYATE